MSEQSTGFGPFMFGVVIGAALGFLFAPEAGAASRTKLARRVRELAAEQIDELGELAKSGDADEEDEGAPTPRAALARRLTDAKRRRRLAPGALVLVHPVTQGPFVDPQVPGHLRDRLAGLPNDTHRTLAELPIEPTSRLSHEPLSLKV